MTKKASGVLAAAVLLVAACGQDRSETPSADTLKKQGQGNNPVTAKKESCDLLPQALQSSEGWVSVRRGAEEYLAHPVMMTPELVAQFKSIDRSFDPSRNCVQVLKGAKGAQQAFFEIVPEACGARGVIGEERAFAFRLNIGQQIAIQQKVEAPTQQGAPTQGQNKVTPAPVQQGQVKPTIAPVQQGQVQAQPQAPVQQGQVKTPAPVQQGQLTQAPAPVQGKNPVQAPKVEAPKVEAPKVVEAPKAPKGPSCLVSQYGLVMSEKKAGERTVGSFEVRLRIESLPVQNPTQQQGQGQNPKGKVVVQEQQKGAGKHIYEFWLNSLCSDNFRSACAVGLNNGLLEGVKFTATQTASTEQGQTQQGKIPTQQQHQQGKVTPVQQQPAPQKPVVEAPQKPVQQPAPQKPVVVEAPQKPVQQPAPQKPAPQPAPQKPVQQPAPQQGQTVAGPVGK